PEILEWAKGQFSEEEIVAGLREIRTTGGLELSDFIHELEQDGAPREGAAPHPRSPNPSSSINPRGTSPCSPQPRSASSAATLAPACPAPPATPSGSPWGRKRFGGVCSAAIQPSRTLNSFFAVTIRRAVVRSSSAVPSQPVTWPSSAALSA